MTRLEEFRILLREKLGKLSSYVQVNQFEDDEGSVYLGVMCFNKLPRKLRRSIPKKFGGVKVVMNVIGSGNKVVTK